jgi:hypothetical protein
MRSAAPAAAVVVAGTVRVRVRVTELPAVPARAWPPKRPAMSPTLAVLSNVQAALTPAVPVMLG